MKKNYFEEKQTKQTGEGKGGGIFWDGELVICISKVDFVLVIKN